MVLQMASTVQSSLLEYHVLSVMLESHQWPDLNSMCVLTYLANKSNSEVHYLGYEVKHSFVSFLLCIL